MFLTLRLNLLLCGVLCGVGSAGRAAPVPGTGPEVIVNLRNGDRLTGRLLAQQTNVLILATTWAEALTLPLSAVGGVQSVRGENLRPPLAAGVSSPASSPEKVSVAAAGKSAPLAKPAAPPKRLRNSIQIGSNFNFGARDSELIYGRLKSTYERPYEEQPKLFFRAFGDYTVDYGRTEKLVSANRMNGSLKTDFDLSPRYYGYGSGSSGFDEVRKIDFQYDYGAGAGLRLVTSTNVALSLEGGLNYQDQQRSEGRDTESLFYRVANNLTWRLGPRLTWTEKFEFFLNGDRVEQYRFRWDTTLSFKLLDNLALNLTALDIYDTDPAPRVNRNELQLRSSIELRF